MKNYPHLICTLEVLAVPIFTFDLFHCYYYFLLSECHLGGAVLTCSLHGHEPYAVYWIWSPSS